MTDIAHVIEFKTNNDSGSYADFTLNMSGVPLEYHDNEKYEMAILNGYLKFNTPNFSVALGNESYSAGPSGGEFAGNLGDGRYNISDIQDQLIRHAKFFGYPTTAIKIYPVPSLEIIVIEVSAGHSITLSAGFANMLGFAAGTYTAGINGGTSKPKIDEGIVYLNVVCDAVERNIIPSNGGLFTNDGILETFQYNALSSSILNLHSDYLTWRPLRQHTGHISNMRFRILDQDGNLIAMKEPVYFIIGLRIIK